MLLLLLFWCRLELLLLMLLAVDLMYPLMTRGELLLKEEEEAEGEGESSRGGCNWKHGK